MFFFIRAAIRAADRLFRLTSLNLSKIFHAFFLRYT